MRVTKQGGTRVAVRRMPPLCVQANWACASYPGLGNHVQQADRIYGHVRTPLQPRVAPVCRTW